MWSDIDIQTVSLVHLGRFIASRTANVEAAKIADSSAPQLRYDAVMLNLVRDPQQYAEFSAEELRALAERVGDAKKRRRALEDLNSTSQ